MDINKLLDPEPAEMVPDEDTKVWMRNIDNRLRRVEKLCYTLIGALPVLTFVRACVG